VDNRVDTSPKPTSYPQKQLRVDIDSARRETLIGMKNGRARSKRRRSAIEEGSM